MEHGKLVRNIRSRLASEYDIPKDALPSNEVIANIIKIYYDEIMMVIAECDSVKTPIGVISGIEKSPTKLTGTAACSHVGHINSGWSSYKKGFPKIQWSKDASNCDVYPPETFFNMPEHRYTSAAREFRHDAGLPEIMEFDGLSEEKIKEINAKADEIEFAKLPPRVQRQKKKDARNNAWKVKGAHKLWIEADRAALKPSKEFEGKLADPIEQYLAMFENLPKDMRFVRKLEIMRVIRDIAVAEGKEEFLPRIDKKISNIEKVVKEYKLTELPHTEGVTDFYVWLGTSGIMQFDEYHKQSAKEAEEKKEAAFEDERKQLIQDMMEVLGINNEEDLKEYIQKETGGNITNTENQ